MQVIRLILKDIWFDKIKNGSKTHEYRELKDYWIQRFFLGKHTIDELIQDKPLLTLKAHHIEFVRGYTKNAEKMYFEIKSVQILPNGIETDLKIKTPILDITLGKKLK